MTSPRIRKHEFNGAVPNRPNRFAKEFYQRIETVRC